MSIQDLGSIGELIGAIATVATLGYLALQIRQNTRVATTSAMNARVDQRTHQSEFIAQTPEINRLFWAGLDEPESLSIAEYQHFEGIFGAYFNADIAAFNLQQENVLSSAEWHSQIESLRWLGSKPGFRRYWETWNFMFVPEFVEFVNEQIRDTDTN